jgi:hypothetical protein
VVSEIEQYCRRNQVDIRLTYYIQLAYEELVQQLLISRLEDTQVDVIIEYSTSEKRAVMTAKWNGPRFDIDSISDEPSFLMIKGISDNISYEHKESDEQANQIVIEMSQK